MSRITRNGVVNDVISRVEACERLFELGSSATNRLPVITISDIKKILTCLA